MMGTAPRTAEGEASWALTGAIVCCSYGLAQVHLAACSLPVHSGLTCVCPELHIWSCSFASVTNHSCSNFWMEKKKINTSAVKLKINMWDTNLQSISSSCWQGYLSQINTTDSWVERLILFGSGICSPYLSSVLHLQAKMAHVLRIDLHGQCCLLLNH